MCSNNKILAVLLFFVGLLCFSQAQAQTATLIGTGNNVSGVTTTSDCPIGSLIVVALNDFSQQNTDFSGATISDNATGGSNTYAFAGQSPSQAGVVRSALFYSSNTAHDLPNGGTITGPVALEVMQAACITTFSGGFDQTAGAVNNTAVTAITVTVPTLAQATEIVVGTATSNANFVGVVEGNGYTRIATTLFADFAYLFAASTTPPAYNPNSFSSDKNSGVIATFKATGGGGGATFNGRSLLGVGK